MAHGQHNHFVVDHFIKYDVRILPDRHAPQPYMTRDSSCPGELPQHSFDLTELTQKAIGRLWRPFPQIGEYFLYFICSEVGIPNPHNAYFAQMARIRASVAISPRATAPRAFITAASSSGESSTGVCSRPK